MTPAEPRDAGVIDIGSNSVRLVLYRLEGRAVWTVYNEKVLAGLGRDLRRTGRLSVEGTAAALAALRRFAVVLEAVRPDHLFVAATAAVREAEDGPAFRDRVAAETGLTIRVLSGEDEARFAALGVLAGTPGARGVAADLGGASLELIRLDDGGPGQARLGPGVTLPLGPFTLADGAAFDAGAVRQRVAARLAPVAGAMSADTLHAVGGAWRSLAQLHMETHRYPLRIVHQYAIAAAEARDLARFVAQQSRASLERLPGVSKKRAETLPYAALVLEGLIDTLGLKRVAFSAWGLREGLLFETLDRDRSDRKSAPADPLIAGCAALGARQGIAPHLPAALCAWLGPVIAALPPAFGAERDAVLAEAACRLADLGARLHPDHRLELAFDQVLRAPVPGQNHVERAFLAATLNGRYGGPAQTPQPEVIERLLPPDGRLRARALGQAMRLACDLSGRAPELLAQVKVSVGDGALRLTAAEGWRDALLGEQTRRRAKALAETLGLEIRLG